MKEAEGWRHRWDCALPFLIPASACNPPSTAEKRRAGGLRRFAGQRASAGPVIETFLEKGKASDTV